VRPGEPSSRPIASLRPGRSGTWPRRLPRFAGRRRGPRADGSGRPREVTYLAGSGHRQATPLGHDPLDVGRGLLGLVFALVFIAVLVVVVVPVTVPVATVLPADAVDDDAHDLDAQVGEQFLGPFGGWPSVLGDADGQQHAIDAAGDDTRVGDGQQRRAVDQDVIVAVAEFPKQALE